MNKKFLWLLFSVMLLLPSLSYGQNGKKKVTEYCNDYHIKHCKFQQKDIGYKYNSQSRSALFKPGQKSTFKVSVFKGHDYRMTFKGEDILLQGKPLMFKVMDSKTKKVFYQTSEENWNPDFEFYCSHSMNLVVELLLPEVPYKPNDEVLYGCLGFLMENRHSIKTGF